MQYALLIYNPDDDVADQAQRPIDPDIAAVLDHPDVTGWIRLHAPGLATTVSHTEDRTLLTDGPFIDSKEFLGGLILVEADNLDGAIAIAVERAGLRPARVVAIEVRPVRGRWLISTARNRAIDHIRRQRALAEKTKLLARELASRP